MSGDAFELLCGALGSILLRPAGVGSIAGEEGPALGKVVLHKSYCQPCYWLRISHGKMAKGALAIFSPADKKDSESSRAQKGLIGPPHLASFMPGHAIRPIIIIFSPHSEPVNLWLTSVKSPRDASGLDVACQCRRSCPAPCKSILLVNYFHWNGKLSVYFKFKPQLLDLVMPLSMGLKAMGKLQHLRLCGRASRRCVNPCHQVA